MNLTDIAKQPKLVKVEVKDKETVKEYGEPVVFWCYDRQPISTFLKMASIDESDISTILDIVKDIVRDEKGKLIINDETTMPPALLMKIVSIVVDDLGN